MDSMRSVIGVSVAQLMVLSAMVPAYADVSESEEDHRRLHGRRHPQTVSHSREDYPVIANWLTSADAPGDITK
jgi:hypothetical protein